MAQKSGKCGDCGKRTTRKVGRDAHWWCLSCAKEAAAEQAAEDRSINEGYERAEQMQSNRYFAIYGND